MISRTRSVFDSAFWERLHVLLVVPSYVRYIWPLHDDRSFRVRIVKRLPDFRFGDDDVGVFESWQNHTSVSVSTSRSEARTSHSRKLEFDQFDTRFFVENRSVQILLLVVELLDLP